MVRLRSRKHEWFLVQTTNDAKASDLLKARKASWVGMQGAGRSLITQQEYWCLQKQWGLRGEDP